ncbi:hypothetical protein J2129_000857 [Methanofollis sp. W23]|nr:hypothetical protein [Methanofollis sp. W23]
MRGEKPYYSFYVSIREPRTENEHFEFRVFQLTQSEEHESQ